MNYLDPYYIFFLYNLDKFSIYDDGILDFEYIHPTIRKSISFPLFLENLISHNLTEEIIFEVHEVKDGKETMNKFSVKRGEDVSMKVLNKYPGCVGLDSYTIGIKPQIKKGEIKIFLEEYFNSWENQEIDMTYVSFFRSKKQLEMFSEILKKKLEDYGKGFEYKFMNLTEIDELSLLVYFWINEGVIIKKDCLDTISPVNQDIFFLIEIDKNFLLKQPKKGIIFDKDSGKVYDKNKLLGTISIGTLPFRFFEILYDNIGKKVSHEEIHKHMYSYANTRQQSNELKKDLSESKRQLPEDIKSIIEAPIGYYIIP